MAIRVACPSCDAAISFSEATAGEVARCPECGKKLSVPEKRAARPAGGEEPRPRKKKK